MRSFFDEKEQWGWNHGLWELYVVESGLHNVGADLAGYEVQRVLHRLCMQVKGKVFPPNHGGKDEEGRLASADPREPFPGEGHDNQECEPSARPISDFGSSGTNRQGSGNFCVANGGRNGKR